MVPGCVLLPRCLVGAVSDAHFRVLFEWAYFRKTKSGIKVHTLFDVATQIPAYIHITEAKLHDVKAMDEIPYEPNTFYIFDKGYYDLARLYRIQCIGTTAPTASMIMMRHPVRKLSDIL